MEDVRLLEGIFKDSQDIGKEYLLELDVDRLLAPCYEAADQDPKKPRYGGWEARQISGHSLGHWLSAAAQMYLATKDEELKEKIDYAVSELAYLQSLDDKGYVSGFPRKPFDQVFTGEFEVDNFSLANWWVPWYSIDKIYAGLIDVYRYTANQQALEVLTKLADWAKEGTDNLTDEEFQRMLICEHGGMNEAMANLYEVTENQDYLDLAIRFSHQEILEPLAENKDELQGKHANTQIPKVIGAAKIYDLNGNEDFKNLALFFWEQVIKHRSYVIGGNSRNEHFDAPDTEKLGVATTETCNTYNMMQLTEQLYSWDHKVEYMDYYEGALYNHILGSQDPDSGMKTYFVATKPGHFKVYCTPDNSFWCCTGTGMENPARYIRQIYHLDQDDLFVNLYISSELDLEERGIKLRQETKFPQSEQTKLVFEKANDQLLKLNIRVPKWIAGKLTAVVNGSEEYQQAENGYLTIERKWDQGDTIEITLPMDLHLYTAMDDEHRVAVMYGPIVLAGALGKEKFPENDIVGDHLIYNNHPGITVPTLVVDEAELNDWIKPVDKEKLVFETTAIGQPGDQKIKLLPFYDLHHERYTVYWQKMTIEEYETWLQEKEDYQEQLDAATIDAINPHEQQPEIEHNLKTENSYSDYSLVAEKAWRDARDGGFFSYDVKVKPDEQMYLMVTYWGSDMFIGIDGKHYERDFDILINDEVIVSQRLECKHPGELFDVFYPIPQELTLGQKQVEVRFQSSEGTIAGGVYELRITSESL